MRFGFPTEVPLSIFSHLCSPSKAQSLEYTLSFPAIDSLMNCYVVKSLIINMFTIANKASMVSWTVCSLAKVSSVTFTLV